MKTVAIVYHSGFGHTEVLAKHMEKGAASVSGVTTQLIKAEDVTENPAVLNDVDAIIFGSPTYMGGVSAPFKAFMDATAGIWFKHEWKDKVAAGFTTSHSMSGDKQTVLIHMAVFAAQHGMVWVGQGELGQSPDGAPGKEDVVNRVGSYLGLMAQSENAAPEVTPPSGDLKTAEIMGARVATVTKKLRS